MEPEVTFNDLNLNRAAKRKLSKKYGQKDPPLVPIFQGDCFFCHDKVFAAEGQALNWANGAPTHKACRKTYAHLLKEKS